MEPVEIQTTDGARLVGQWTVPSQPRAAAVLHGATGVPASYYGRFAAWAAEARGLAVLTYDYRGMGASATGPVREARVSMADWGVRDQSAALDHALMRFADLPVWTIGHSLGGFCLPFHANADRVARHIAVASGPAYWRAHPWRFMPSVLAFWFVLGPAATALLGYLPGHLMGLNADIPGPAYWEWRRWCVRAAFYRPDWGRTLPMPGRVTCPVDLVGIADDVMIPPHRVAKLAEYFPAAPTRFREIAPADAGVAQLGHIAVFAGRNAGAWPLILPAA
ncbi:MAG: alpha/beta fold hydrolase [Pseudomonadota bacterium]